MDSLLDDLLVVRTMKTPEHEKPVAFKIAPGYVRQDFVDGKCVGQKFVAETTGARAGDHVDWEDEVGNSISCPVHRYQSYDMKQPDDAERVEREIEHHDLTVALIAGLIAGTTVAVLVQFLR